MSGDSCRCIVALVSLEIFLEMLEPESFKPEAQVKAFEDLASLARQASMRGVLGKTDVTHLFFAYYDSNIKFHE